ncbi:GAF and ANTAR domain-containing protein [Streptomyces anthocyanicus]|uniref:GAF and ANTAR domain-containing protein n=1 Tax=Streptomyces anthocyanicus TaxID=68174 RepID=UPI002DD7C10B|nr:GAF and ANTAR domain-containing protein [Streptomyces anthocyanicus]WSB59108.1 GAF and ANTAR domain-containing protein [Streptomyces anthocyanicus]
MDDWRRFAQQMASLARDLLSQESLHDTLDRITASATELVEDCDAAGILILRGTKVQSLAPTEQVVIDSDALQGRVGEGPCFDAARSGTGERQFRIADFTDEAQRWPKYVPEARKLNLGSMMGFLLFTEDEDLGALNMYSYRPGAFTEADETAGWLLASHAAVAFSSARTHAQMQEAIGTRHTIGEAMGILMGRHRMSEDQAFAALRRYSQDHNVKLRDVAAQVCERGGLPEPTDKR